MVKCCYLVRDLSGYGFVMGVISGAGLRLESGDWSSYSMENHPIGGKYKT